MRRSTIRFFASIIIGALAANLIIYSETLLALRLCAASVLLFVLPGMALMWAIFPPGGAPPLSERVILSLGSGLALSVVWTWLFFLSPLGFTKNNFVWSLDLLVISLSIAAVVRASRGLRHPRVQSPLLRRELVLLAMLACFAVVGFTFLAWNLDYTELSGDERDVAIRAVDVILGKESRLFSLPKGPGQILLTAAFMRLGDSLTEASLRLPFVLSAVLSTLVFMLIARMRLPTGIALFAACLLLSQGLLVGLSRWVQYQMYVLCMIHLALYCGLRGWNTRGDSPSTRYWVLSALFGGAGLLGHYDAAFVAPALLYLFYRTYRGRLFTIQTLMRAATVAGIALLIGAPFYLMLALAPGRAAAIGSSYVDVRVNLGQAPYNHLGDLVFDMWDFESPYRVIVVAALLIIALIAALERRHWQPRWLMPVLLASAGGFALSALQGNLFIVNGINFAFLPFVVLVGTIAWRLARDPFWIGVILWLFAAWGFTEFLMAAPYDHYFPGLPALVLCAAWGLARLPDLLRIRAPRFGAMPWRPAALAIGAMWCGIVLTYVFFEHMLNYPATLVQYPERVWPPFGNLLSTRQQSPAYYSNSVGWHAVAALYQTGELRGENESTVKTIRDWYLYKIWEPLKPTTRLFLLAGTPKPYREYFPPPDDLRERFDLWGTIYVHGDPQIEIYQRKGDPISQRIIRAEDYESIWQQSAQLSRLESDRANRRDDAAFYDLGRALAVQQRAGDAVIFSSASARYVYSLYDQSNLPFTNAHGAWSAYRRIWGVFWQDDADGIERLLAAQLFPSTPQWFKNVRVRSYGVAPDTSLIGQTAHFGDLATLAARSVLPRALRPGELLPVELQWQVDNPTSARYRLFVHVTADEHAPPAAQTDDEPVAGLRPTNGWRRGETINSRMGVWLPANLPPGSYQVRVGLYDPDDGTRLPVIGPDGARAPDHALSLGALSVSGQ